MNQLLEVFKPNNRLSKKNLLIMSGMQVLALFAYWIFSKNTYFPKPNEIINAFTTLVSKENLIGELYESTVLAMQAVLITTIISLIISYLTVIPFFRPLAYFVSKLRFLSLVGLSFLFTMMTSNGHQLKISLLVFGMSVFFVTSFCEVIASISKNEYIHARTLRMSEWQVVWEVIILGKLEMVFEVIRQNFAIAWMMLTMVEGISRAEGGVGTMLLNQNKHLHLSSVFAIQITIFLVGILFDYLFGLAKVQLFPYCNLTKEKK